MAGRIVYLSRDDALALASAGAGSSGAESGTLVAPEPPAHPAVVSQVAEDRAARRSALAEERARAAKVRRRAAERSAAPSERAPRASRRSRRRRGELSPRTALGIGLLVASGLIGIGAWSYQGAAGSASTPRSVVEPLSSRPRAAAPFAFVRRAEPDRSGPANHPARAAAVERSPWVIRGDAALDEATGQIVVQGFDRLRFDEGRVREVESTSALEHIIVLDDGTRVALPVETADALPKSWQYTLHYVESSRNVQPTEEER